MNWTITKQCECGCGEEIPLWKTAPPRFKHGHNATQPIEAMYEITQVGCWEWVGKRNNYGYGVKFFGGKARQAHRWVYELHRGKIPDGLELDHICRNKACVNPEHLRPVSHAHNGQNLPHQGRGSSEFRGVQFNPRSGRWKAAVKLDYKSRSLGEFDTEEEAASAAASFRANYMPYSVETM